MNSLNGVFIRTLTEEIVIIIVQIKIWYRQSIALNSEHFFFQKNYIFYSKKLYICAGQIRKLDACIDSFFLFLKFPILLSLKEEFYHHHVAD